MNSEKAQLAGSIDRLVVRDHEIADWIVDWSNGRVNKAIAALAARRYINGVMCPCVLRSALEERFPYNVKAEARRTDD